MAMNSSCPLSADTANEITVHFVALFVLVITVIALAVDFGLCAGCGVYALFGLLRRSVSGVAL